MSEPSEAELNKCAAELLDGENLSELMSRYFAGVGEYKLAAKSLSLAGEELKDFINDYIERIKK